MKKYWRKLFGINHKDVVKKIKIACEDGIACAAKERERSKDPNSSLSDIQKDENNAVQMARYLSYNQILGIIRRGETS